MEKVEIGGLFASAFRVGAVGDCGSRPKVV